MVAQVVKIIVIKSEGRCYRIDDNGICKPSGAAPARAPALNALDSLVVTRNKDFFIYINTQLPTAGNRRRWQVASGKQHYVLASTKTNSVVQAAGTASFIMKLGRMKIVVSVFKKSNAKLVVVGNPDHSTPSHMVPLDDGRLNVNPVTRTRGTASADWWITPGTAGMKPRDLFTTSRDYRDSLEAGSALRGRRARRALRGITSRVLTAACRGARWTVYIFNTRTALERTVEAAAFDRAYVCDVMSLLLRSRISDGGNRMTGVTTPSSSLDSQSYPHWIKCNNESCYYTTVFYENQLTKKDLAYKTRYPKQNKTDTQHTCAMSAVYIPLHTDNIELKIGPSLHIISYPNPLVTDPRPIAAYMFHAYRRMRSVVDHQRVGGVTPMSYVVHQRAFESALLNIDFINLNYIQRRPRLWSGRSEIVFHCSQRSRLNGAYSNRSTRSTPSPTLATSAVIQSGKDF
ncbi:hypothetical protein EVAR_8723_1 [Eumeta japonica]|uniref:Uncharacterized protein n=1 Tax=Eumeta variegata TaxID=151549 RepID=A0A4C1XIL6_EUMVA|nr:hypothetical protein EVAR_8723_1 [Eumeta japonica]